MTREQAIAKLATSAEWMTEQEAEKQFNGLVNYFLDPHERTNGAYEYATRLAIEHIESEYVDEVTEEYQTALNQLHQ
jgi:hypothetical protein